MAIISRRRPVLPNPEALQVKVPIQGGAAGQLVDGANHAAYWWGLRSGLWTWDYKTPTSGTLEQETPNGTSITVRGWLKVTPTSDALFLWVHYQAYDIASGGAPSIVAHLDNITDGAASKDSIQWQTTDGTLPVLRAGANGDHRYPPLTVTSTTRVDATPAVTPSTPRALNLVAADAGDEIAVRLVCTNVRPLGMRVIERYRVEVT